MAAPPKGDLKTFLIKVGAVTLAALVVLYAAKTWLGFGGREKAPDGDVISWRQAAKHYDEYLTVEGRIVRTHRTEKACFLNFHPDWRHSFSAVIFASRFDAFPPKPEEHYRGKTVRVTGLIQEYKGRPEIILESTDQSQVIR